MYVRYCDWGDLYPVLSWVSVVVPMWPLLVRISVPVQVSVKWSYTREKCGYVHHLALALH